jgi:tetratricopeptide (TPR) repeat protein
MRREERHHLKQNPLALALTEARGWLAERGRPVLIGSGIVLAALIAVGGYVSWTQLQERRAGELFAEAMFTLESPVLAPPEEPVVALPDPDVDGQAESDNSNASDITDPADATTGGPDDPPSETPFSPPADFVQPPGSFPSLEAKLEMALPQLVAAADAYPDTQQGLTARYQAAAVLIALERADAAAEEYRRVIDLAGDTLYGQMSRMGLAEALLLTGEPQEAIPLLERQMSSLESVVPIDAVLMRLGHAYQLAGQPDDALAAFNRVVEEFPISMYFADAQQEVDTLRQGAGASSSDG